ncbi:MAG: FG-GAP-like repeat-containing protein [Pseudobacter sp.]|uniref:FG-GAP-like repeat-containing protein n=1 Tax=Pseudobacter sp. TaxID=2045420 RepID=UPI003F809763
MKNILNPLQFRHFLLCLLVCSCSNLFAQSNPGGVSGALVWLKGNQGVTTNGNNVTSWTNQSGPVNFIGKGNPQLSNAQVNFQPAIVFSGSNSLTSTATLLAPNSAYTKFVVFKYDTDNTNNLVSAGPGAPGHALYGANTTTDVILWHDGKLLAASNVVTNSKFYMATAGFNSGVANGTFINVDGANKAAMNASKGYGASYMQIGAYRDGNNLAGRIAEVIVYPTAMTSTANATRQIQSYLAIKYGITAAHNYLASNAAVVYDASTFNYNIAGLGRDDNSSLYQKQSRNINEGNQVLMTLGSLAASNNGNTATITNDRQFLIWGDNNGAFNSTSTITGWTSLNTRLNRIWKLQNTGSFSQQVTMYVPTAAFTSLPGSNPYLIYNTSNTLNGGGTMVASSGTANIGGVAHTAYTVTFPTTGTLYFSFAAKTVNPGSVAGATVWLRADAGMSTSGNNILNWTNQVNAANSFNGTGNPQLSASDVNFNPGVRFSGSNYLTSTGNTLTGNSAYTKFVVFKYDGSATNNIVSSPSGGNNAFFGSNSTTNIHLWHSGNILSANNSVSANRYYMATGGFTRSLTGGTYINIDGANTITGTSSAAYVTSGTQLGAHTNAAHLNGRIAEVIIFPSSLGNTSLNTRKIESYLGVKYGLPVRHDYIASDATVTYTIATFGNHIAGIGRDDSTALYQKQGRSVNPGTLQVLMAVNAYAASNQQNTGVIPADKQFLIWGDNAAAHSTSTMTGWTTVNTRLNRIWKLRNTNGFNQQVTVYFPATGLINLPGTNPYLVYNTSATLAGGGTEVPVASTVTIEGVVHKGFTVTFPAGTSELYFTFASKAIQPAGVAGAAVWLRPDAGLNTTGTTVTNWINQVNPNNSFTNTGTPTYAASNLNFHPGVTFNGSSYLTSAAIVTPANSNYTKFVVFKYDNATTTNNIISAGNSGNSAIYANSTATNIVLWHSSPTLTAANVVDMSRYYLATGGFNSGTTNGMFINVNGTNRAQMTSSAAYTASDLQLGAYGGGNNLNGRIAEVIVYPTALGTATVPTRRIQSYLGVKYGLTLGHNYLASNGTTTTYDISTHAANIAGIGRDDNADLKQLQGRSNVTTAEQITVAVGAVAASNEENLNTIASDNQFLVWGDDNASITITMPVTGFTNVNNRFARVWKLQNTGSFNQQVTVYIPTAALNGLTNTTKYLIYNTSAMLAGAGTEVAANASATIGGVPHTGFRLTFPTTGTLYFSFGSYAVHPGAVNGADVWLRSDAGVNLTGSNVTSWVNQRNTNNNFTSTGTVQYSPAAANFNPTMIYSGSSYFSSASNVTTVNTGNYTKFVVFRSAEGTGGRNLMSAYNGNPGTAMHTADNSFIIRNATLSNATPVSSLNSGKQWLGTQVFNRGVTNGTLLRLNGASSLSVTDNSTHSVDRLQIGAYGSSNFLSAGSNIAEAIMYNSALPVADYRRVESYLAVKYGLTLQNDYLNTNSTTIYTLAGYPDHVAGIGLDANTGLDQRQSKSADPGNQVVMALGQLAESNEANTNTFAANLQHLTWGDNNGAGFLYDAGISQKRLLRTWKLQNSGSFNQAVTVYYPVAGLYGLGETPSLIYGTLSSLDDGSATRVSAGSPVQINGESYHAFQLTFPVTGTQYFSFAGTITPEICGNGIDDDLDGYIDNLDVTCSPIPPCTATAPALTNFSITQEWVTTPANNLAASASPTVADLDGDGMPEILVVRAAGAGITVFKGDGSNASKNTVDYNIQLPVRASQSTMQAAVADVDRDGVPEVVVVGNDAYVYVFNNVSGSTSNYKFRSADTVTTYFRNGSPRIADIDEDGTPEIIVGLDVFQFDFARGLLVKAVIGVPGPAGRTGRAAEWGCDVVVIDIMPNNPGKEIVAGSRVYGVNLNTGVTTTLANLSTIAGTSLIPAGSDGPTAVADLDLDGQLDITYPTGTHLVIWDPVAGVMKMRAAYNNNGTEFARGMPTIANVYNEKVLNGAATDLPEVLFNCDFNMHAFNLNKLTGSVWSLATTDGSGETGVTAFDLNGDGILEIVYNDETNIRVINGNTATPANIATYASGTATWMEHPVVVDVDNDGSAEFVCVSGATTAFTGNLRVFGATAGTTVWQNTRKIWNGRGYRARGINDDLTVPVKEQNILLQYPAGSGRYPLNIFNGQADERLLDPGIVATSDMAVSDLEVLNSETSCEFTPAAAKLAFTISNNGSAAASAGEPLRFYLGDPRKAGAVRLPVTRTLQSSLTVGASLKDTVTLNLSTYTAPYRIYIVTNDNGTATIPFTLPLSNANARECDYENNIDSVVLNPVPADLGNLSATYPSASASIRSVDRAWLGINAPDAECTPDENDDADGLVMTSGSTNGNGSKATPWIVKGIDTECKFTITVNGNGDPKPVYWAAWFDADGNGSFTDDLDVFTSGELTHGSPVSTNFSFIVPPAIGATNGAVRIIATSVDPAFSKGMNGTGNFVNGEVEDFYITYAWPLPVTLTAFTAAPTANCTVQLKWNTSMEQNSSHFNIEVYNGKEFVTLATVPSYNIATGANYSFVHNDVQEGDVNYRLKHFDIDGKHQYSRVVTAKVTCSNIAIRLTPNPVSETGVISGLRAGDRVALFNADGKLAMEQVVSGAQYIINVKKLPSGVYMAQIIRNGTAVTTIKVVKK